jgi:hypothetical protein
MFGFEAKELKILQRLNTPQKIQDYLNTIPINFERGGETCMFPRRVLKENKAHCLEGAMLASAVLWLHGERPLLLDLKTTNKDFDHVVALFRRNDRWGALSKTNHAVLRYRDPVHRTVGELAMSYFNEYFLDNGKKTLRSYSKPFDLSKFRNRNWTTAEKDLWYISEALDNSPHIQILGPSGARILRRADPIEIHTGKITEWS